MRIGVHYLGDGTCEFAVWAPLRTTVDLLILSSGSETVYPMKKDDRGYWHSTVDGVSEGTQYLYRLDVISNVLTQRHNSSLMVCMVRHR